MNSSAGGNTVHDLDLRFPIKVTIHRSARRPSISRTGYPYTTSVAPEASLSVDAKAALAQILPLGGHFGMKESSGSSWLQEFERMS
mmetsp:Transcript_12334/g.26042  ORF Transcript_12334/g.26042 Transcript_12334/m.26042 type:complete len:86 (+) Transcript_12334:1370-1627(+)